MKRILFYSISLGLGEGMSEGKNITQIRLDKNKGLDLVKKNVGKSQGQAEHPKTQQNHGPCLFSVSSFFKCDYVVAADQMPSH